MSNARDDKGVSPATLGLPPIFDVLWKTLPLGILVRSLLEWLLDEPTLEKLTGQAAPEQYTRELTMGTLVKLMIQVAAGNRASVFAAYRADVTSPTPEVTVSYQAVYGKLGRMNPVLGEELVRFSATRVGELIAGLEKLPEPLAGYHTRVVDGNVLTGTDHRLGALRDWKPACLPGKSLVVYEVAPGLVTDLVLCEDAYTQERALVGGLLARLSVGDLLLMDRNFCTTRVVFGVATALAFFIVRQHKANLVWKPAGPWQDCGATATGTLRERPVLVNDPESGQTLLLRQVELRLFQKTREGERVIRLLTNLPPEVTAMQVAELYRDRWTVEKHFQFLTDELHCEQGGLGQPRAALFAFAMALVAGNALAVVRAALRTAHGAAAEATVSGHYLADEVKADYRTLMKLAPSPQWVTFRGLHPSVMVSLLTGLAREVRLGALKKHPRGPKKPRSGRRTRGRNHKHRSTARLLREYREQESC
jgi:hypothetical protein